MNRSAVNSSARRRSARAATLRLRGRRRRRSPPTTRSSSPWSAAAAWAAPTCTTSCACPSSRSSPCATPIQATSGGAMDDVKKASRPTDKVQTETGLPQGRRPQGHRRRHRRHARPLACVRPHRRLRQRQGRLLREAAVAQHRRGPGDGRTPPSKNKRVVQIGTQQRSGQHFQDAVAVSCSPASSAMSTCAGPGSPTTRRPRASATRRRRRPRRRASITISGSGRRRSDRSTRNRFHYQFRWFWDYGNGLCNDWGVHLNDIILWGMKVAGAALGVAPSAASTR